MVDIGHRDCVGGSSKQKGPFSLRRLSCPAKLLPKGCGAKKGLSPKIRDAN